MIKNIQLKKMNKKDWDAVSKIYKEDIETEIPFWESWNKNHVVM